MKGYYIDLPFDREWPDSGLRLGGEVGDVLIWRESRRRSVQELERCGKCATIEPVIYRGLLAWLATYPGGNNHLYKRLYLFDGSGDPAAGLVEAMYFARNYGVAKPIEFEPRYGVLLWGMIRSQASS